MIRDGMRHVRDVKLFDTKLSAEQGEWPALAGGGTHVVLTPQNTIIPVNFPAEDIYDSNNLFTLENLDNLDYCVLNIGIRVTAVTVGGGAATDTSTLQIFTWPEFFLRRGLQTNQFFLSHAMLENPPKAGTAFQRGWCAKPMGQTLPTPNATPPYFGTMPNDSALVYSFNGFPIHTGTAPALEVGDRVLWSTMIGNAVQMGVPTISGLRKIHLIFWFPAKLNTQPVSDLFVDMEIWASFFEQVQPR